MKLAVPILTTSVQEKIVEILDKFTTLEAELEAELGCRLRQYAYYRTHLLDFSVEMLKSTDWGNLVQWKSLGEVSEFYGGLSGKVKADFSDNTNAYYIPYKNIFTNIVVDVEQVDKVRIVEGEKQNQVQAGDLLVTGSSEIIDEVGMTSIVPNNIGDNMYLNSFSFGVRFNQDVELLPDFIKHLFRSYQIRKQIVKTANGVTRFNVSKKSFKELIIPVPPMFIQEKIVSILDKFDALTNSITEGLPKEIELRRKQYEYYRNQLLSFPEYKTTV